MFSSYCAAFAYLGLLWIAGYVLFCLIAGRAQSHPLEILGLSGLLGSSAVPTVLFWFSLAGIAPNRGLLGVLFAICLMALFGLKWKGRLVRPLWLRSKLTRADLWMVPFALPIGWLLWAATQEAMTHPLVTWDAFAVWGFRAKALYLDSIPHLHGYFHDQSLDFAPLDYPLLLPFLTAGGYAAMGGINESLGKLPVVFLLCCYVFFLYAALRSLLPRTLSLALTAAAVSAPMVMRFCVQGIPDMPLAIFYAASLWFAVRWMEGGPRSDAWLAALFSVACVFIKNEGVPLAIFNLLAMLVFARKHQARAFRDLAIAAAAGLVCLLPWIIFRQSLPHVSENYPGHLNWATISANHGRLFLILQTYVNRMFFDANWSLHWLLIFVVFLGVNSVRPSRSARILLLLLVAHLAAYVLAYEITPYSLEALLMEPLDRLLLHVLPAGILQMAFSLAQIAPAADDACLLRTP
jgi:hypothetical protein